VRRKRSDVTAAYGGQPELTGKKKGLGMQARSFLESKNTICMKGWHSNLSLKIGEISNIF
jgi:hypothetical protein